jgi:hypothetical protein
MVSHMGIRVLSESKENKKIFCTDISDSDQEKRSARISKFVTQTNNPFVQVIGFHITALYLLCDCHEPVEENARTTISRSELSHQPSPWRGTTT